MVQPFNHEYFMKAALQEARLAFDEGEIPVGAVITHHNKIIAKTHNATEKLTDVTAHAEIMAITSASNHLQSKYLRDCTLYVTLEPCVMCAGALFWAQLGRLVYATDDPKRGFTQSSVQLHPKTVIDQGILSEESAELLRLFFERLR